MSLAESYQQASEDAKKSRSSISFSDAKEELTIRSADRMLLHDTVQEFDSSMSVKDLESYLSLKETKERMGGDTGLSSVATKSLGRDTSKDAAYEEVYALYEARRDAFDSYVSSDSFGEDTENPYYQLYQTAQNRLEEYAGVTGHMGGKDHGYTPQLRSLDGYREVDEAVLSYLSEKRNTYGYNEQFKVDCTDFHLDDGKRGRVIQALNVDEQAFYEKVAAAKTMVGSSNEQFRSMFRGSDDKSAGQFASAVSAFGEALAGATNSAVEDTMELQ